MMAAFAGYGFPKAHAAAYAKLGWRSAWCKSHYPAEFMAAVLANWGGDYSQRVYLGEARRMGLTVRPPHINYSQHNFAVKKLQDSEDRVLFMGLYRVKELTNQTIRRIFRFAPFSSVEDFLTRADPRIKGAENLAPIGALDGMGNDPFHSTATEKWWMAAKSDEPVRLDRHTRGGLVATTRSRCATGSPWHQPYCTPP
jgi:DNA polymerase III alpha subunit